jgi:hypothetical protein
MHFSKEFAKYEFTCTRAHIAQKRWAANNHLFTSTYKLSISTSDMLESGRADSKYVRNQTLWNCSVGSLLQSQLKPF